jgi:hypothetical protein
MASPPVPDNDGWDNRTGSLHLRQPGVRSAVPNKPPFSSGWCVNASPVPFGPIRLNQRIKAPFRGTVTVWIPDTTLSVVIGWGNQPGIEFSSRPAVVWPLPGSGTYRMGITLKWQTELAEGTTSYSVPLYVSR